MHFNLLVGAACAASIASASAINRRAIRYETDYDTEYTTKYVTVWDDDNDRHAGNRQNWVNTRHQSTTATQAEVAPTTSVVVTAPPAQDSPSTTAPAATAPAANNKAVVVDDTPSQPSSTAAVATQSAIIANGKGTHFKQAVVDAHNQARARHGLGTVSWNDTLYEAAQMCADTCWEHYEPEAHGKGHCLNVNHINYGQNIMASYGSSDDYGDVKGAIAGFYSEEKDFASGGNYGNPNANSSHFTQIAWKDSIQVACAQTRCMKPPGWDAMFSTVCNYMVRGNIDGEFANQIPSPVTSNYPWPTKSNGEYDMNADTAYDNAAVKADAFYRVVPFVADADVGKYTAI